MSARPLVVMPTFDEADNLERTAALVLAADPRVDLLVVDDDSPDGTGAIADRLAAAEPRIRVLHRRRRDGLGRAYLEGFRLAIEHGATVVIEMDADGSHPADRLPALLDALDAGADLAIGSRWVPGGRVVDWPWLRRALSRGGNAYARIALGIPVRDATAGFRAYRAERLAGLDLDGVHSRGYCFQIDMTLRAHDAGLRIAEVPIAFTERVAGRSKMSGAIIAEAMLRVTVWALRRRLRRPR
ncbi:polyprenol monophosphomannose synthase [Homoserinibacter sp. YIM 151385]|uniref:polyprenol monophosphomannose synthase n=1 Tax=Homoserinibacter sp. YIM 151385 TaxID=2985506 RepID=UPI0022F03499|nr:polyprenol monophosphomannose synthase [Homoserinibacter sp. YIM 151385]WBU36798.1 polyprenol monophosphomannose synthase [Homoserinibacter sp. YIM 151385]